MEKQSQDERFDHYFAVVEGEMISNQAIEVETASNARNNSPNGHSVELTTLTRTTATTEKNLCFLSVLVPMGSPCIYS